MCVCVHTNIHIQRNTHVMWEKTINLWFYKYSLMIYVERKIMQIANKKEIW